ncbi:Uncharacterised protein [Mycobacterium tuberculosis]|nr:Uncharacterised protein [Mycobacterium tuberculosis]
MLEFLAHRQHELVVVTQVPTGDDQEWTVRRGRQAGTHRGQLATGEPVESGRYLLGQARVAVITHPCR